MFGQLTYKNKVCVVPLIPTQALIRPRGCTLKQFGTPSGAWKCADESAQTCVRASASVPVEGETFPRRSETDGLAKLEWPFRGGRLRLSQKSPWSLTIVVCYIVLYNDKWSGNVSQHPWEKDRREKWKERPSNGRARVCVCSFFALQFRSRTLWSHKEETAFFPHGRVRSKWVWARRPRRMFSYVCLVKIRK